MSADTVTPPPVPPQATPATAPAAPTPPSKPRRRRRWFWRLMPLATLLVCVWFAPAIVANTSLRNRFARQAMADLHGSVDVGGASLGWLSPIELRDVTIKDEAGRTVVSVAKVTSQKSLLALARNQSAPGEFVLESPTITVVCEKNTTNLEAVLVEYLKDDGKPSATRTPVAIRVTGGTLTLTDAETGKTTKLEDINANVSVPASRAEPVTAKLTAATGGISADLAIGDEGSGKFACAGLPLETFAPLLRRVDPTVSVAGAITTDLQVKWGKDMLAVSGTASVKRLDVSAPQLKGDRLTLDSAELPLDVELAGKTLRVRKFDLTCDFGTLSAAGTFNPEEPAEKLLTQSGVVVKGGVDLAKVAARMRKLLRLQDGLELQEGKVEVRLESTAVPGGGVVWDGKVHTTSLKATRDSKPVTWEQPLTVEFNSRYVSGQLPTFEKLICTSDFLAVNAKTTPETIQAAAVVYLQQLTEKLGQFIDLDGIKLTGVAEAQLVARLTPDGAFKASGLIDLKDFAYSDKSGKSLKEPVAKVQFGASGTVPKSGPTRLDKASVVLTASGDEFHATLLEPLADVQKLTSSRLELSISGDLARWRERVAAVVEIPDYQMSGTLVASGKAQLTRERVTVDRLTVGLTNAKFRGAGLIIDEPTMNAVGDVTLTRATNLATITRLTLNSAPLSATDGTLTFEQVKDDIIVAGNGQCVTDLNRLGVVVQLFADPRGEDAFHGRGVGPLRFRYAGGVTSFGGTLDITNFAYGLKDKPTWAEPVLKVEADGDYRDSTDTVTLAVVKVERPGLALDAKGSVNKATTTQDLNFTGLLKYDWAKLTPLVREQLGASFTAQGTGTRAIALSGQFSPEGAAPPPPMPKGAIPLKAPGAAVAPAPTGPSIFAALSGEGAVGWDSIKAYGFDVGPSELKAKMTRGVLAVSPIHATFCGGKVAVTPTVKLDTTPGEVSLAKGPVVDHAKLTPQATAGALGYALPAIANAGQAEGEISAAIDDNRIPLGDFTKTSLKGTLVIHKAVIGASPVVAEVAKLLGAKNTTMTLATETAVPVQVANGRVHHQNFAVHIAGTTIHTSGSVGFDNTLDLVVDVPIPKDLPMLKNNPLLVKAVAGKVVKVPVKGTLSKPAIDPKAFEHAVIALAREGAKGVGKDAFEKELNKLFPGMPAPKGGTGGLPFPLPFGKKP